MNRVELAPGVLSHRCVDCGKWCPNCAHEYFVPERCLACAAPYVDNPPGPDGRVHCRGCDLAFPAELPPGLTTFPRYCRACRAAPVEDAPPPDRGAGEQDTTSSPARRKVRDALRPPPDNPAVIGVARRTGFAPRPQPELYTSELTGAHKVAGNYPG